MTMVFEDGTFMKADIVGTPVVRFTATRLEAASINKRVPAKSAITPVL
jgi:hypothetical protein